MSASKIKLLDLKPAQIAIGLLEVEQRMKDFEQMSKDEFLDYTKDHPVPVVQSDHGFYIIDHHHLCRAYHELGHGHVHFTVLADYSGFDRPKFWALMEEASWVLPQDQFGVRHPYHHLPIDIRGMADDPYRSLVWQLKELGHWHKVDVPFAEFKVANHLRDKVEIQNTKESFDLAVEAAIHLLANLSEAEAAAIPGLK
jgi:hypothetical protein